MSSTQSPSVTTPAQDSPTPSGFLEHKANSTFTPTPTDVLSLRQTLLHFVPLELADIIINDAEYWPALTSSRDAFSGPALVSVPSHSHTKNDAEERENGKEGWCYLVSPAVPKSDDVTYLKVQRVKFSVEVFYEKPEGGCEGESTGAKSWLEATILPPSPSPNDDHIKYQYPETLPTPHPSKRWFIQSNKSMTSETAYDITWDSDSDGSGGGFVDLLRSGDRVGVMCRDLYKGWVNCIYTVRVDVFYSV